MKKKVIYIQEDSNSCGSVCIQSVISHYGGYVPLETIMDDTNTDKTGTNAFEIVQTLKKYGFSSYGRRVPLQEIANSDLPLIAHVIKDGLEHFVVIYAIDGTSVLTMDPAVGEKRYSREEFERIYDEKAVYLFEEGEIPKYNKSRSFTKLIYSMIVKYRVRFTVILFLCVLLLLSNLVVSFHFKMMTRMNPIKLTLLFLLLRSLILILNVFKNRLVNSTMKDVDTTINFKMVSHVLKLPLKYLQRKQTGEIVAKINEIAFIKDLIMRIVIVNSLDILTMLVTSSIIFVISPMLWAVYMLIAVTLVTLSIFSNRFLYKKNKENIRVHNEYAGTLVEYVSGLESIKNLGRTDSTLKKIDSKFSSDIRSKMQLQNFIEAIDIVKSHILESGILIVSCISYLNLNDTFTFYDMLTVTSLFGIFTSSLENVLASHIHFLKGKAIYRNISEFLDIEEEKGGQVLEEQIDKIVISNLQYSYDKIHKNISSLDHTIRRGEKVIIKGPSGIGKSTFAKCLCGRLMNYDGSIKINDTYEIKNIDVDSLRKKVIYVGQDEKLFSGTIRENITGNDNSDVSLEQVLELTSLKETLTRRTRGIDTMILEGATNLSGGEKARIFLARALYKNPEILVIDETLSSVSEQMEEDIITKLISIKNLTVIYITHRQKEKFFDTIIDFRKGGKYAITSK